MELNKTTCFCSSLPTNINNRWRRNIWIIGSEGWKLNNQRVKMSQSYLIDLILKGLGFKNRENSSCGKQNSSSRQRRRRPTDIVGIWRIIGQLNFLEKSTRPTLSMQYINAPGFLPTQASHKTKALRIERLDGKATRSEGLILEPTNSSLEIGCDTDFSGNCKAEPHT